MNKKLIITAAIIGGLITVGCYSPVDYDSDLGTSTSQVSYVDKGQMVSKENNRPKIDLADGDVQMVTSEDCASLLSKSQYLTSYITELYVILGDRSGITPPSPYIKISRGQLGYGNGDLNEGAGGKYIYLCYTKESLFGSPMRNFLIYSGSSSRYYPPTNYYHVRNSDGYSGSRGADLNKGCGGDYIYLMATKNTAIGNPVRNVGIISTTSPLYYPPSGWNWINKDLNKGSGGRFIYFLYQN